jgi:hypothetical protein
VVGELEECVVNGGGMAGGWSICPRNLAWYSMP